MTTEHEIAREALRQTEWNFRFEEDEIIKYHDPSGKEEWPYWEIERRMFDPDEWERVYELTWMHPGTWEMEKTVVSESEQTFEMMPAIRERVEELAEELMEDYDDD